METPVQSALKFESMPLPKSLKQALAKMNFQEPTPIQAQTLPLSLKGLDIMGVAQTGTGKTGAFVIPTIARLMDYPEKTALIMTPTRELALQIFEVAKNMVWFERKLNIALLIGGSSYGLQFQQLRQKPRIIIGTPGRIQDHLDQNSLRVDKVGILVLDEADRMLDMGFAPQIEQILRNVPKERQTYLFTATLPSEIERIGHGFMRNPQRIMVGENSRPIEKIKQEVIQTPEDKKMEILFDQINSREGSVLIFAKTKRRTDRLSQKLVDHGYEVALIHGDRSQKQRNDAILDFKKGHARILVATDVAARGLDVPHIAHVINFDLPQVPEDFIHRIGRTARAGKEGNALTLVTPSERGMWRRIEALIRGDELVGRTTQRPFQANGHAKGGRFAKDYRESSARRRDQTGSDDSRRGGPRRPERGERREDRFEAAGPHRRTNGASRGGGSASGAPRRFSRGPKSGGKFSSLPRSN